MSFGDPIKSQLDGGVKEQGSRYFVLGRNEDFVSTCAAVFTVSSQVLEFFEVKNFSSKYQ